MLPHATPHHSGVPLPATPSPHSGHPRTPAFLTPRSWVERFFPGLYPPYLSVLRVDPQRLGAVDLQALWQAQGGGEGECAACAGWERRGGQGLDPQAPRRAQRGGEGEPGRRVVHCWHGMGAAAGAARRRG